MTVHDKHGAHDRLFFGEIHAVQWELWGEILLPIYLYKIDPASCSFLWHRASDTQLVYSSCIIRI